MKFDTVFGRPVSRACATCGATLPAGVAKCHVRPHPPYERVAATWRDEKGELQRSTFPSPCLQRAAFGASVAAVR